MLDLMPNATGAFPQQSGCRCSDKSMAFNVGLKQTYGVMSTHWGGRPTVGHFVLDEATSPRFSTRWSRKGSGTRRNSQARRFDSYPLHQVHDHPPMLTRSSFGRATALKAVCNWFDSSRPRKGFPHGHSVVNLPSTPRKDWEQRGLWLTVSHFHWVKAKRLRTRPGAFGPWDTRVGIQVRGSTPQSPPSSTNSGAKAPIHIPKLGTTAG